MKQYQPLYLKYRPQKLSELIGQEVVIKTLTNAILYNKIVHAYLFCGPRGTGKTSTARILAKSLNCEKGTSVEPCDKCLSCESIIKGNSLDVIEIDAASHRKVEDAEELINRVSLSTYGSRFKIYIIDEVHMLTDHAFNALLKTLEEPPKNVIFILATTEEYKVIPTIVSRCQKLEFKPVPKNELELKIKDIATKEKIIINQTIINFISNRSNGCLRDAISLLDQISVLQTKNEPIDPKEVFELFGTVDRTTLLKLVEALVNFDKKHTIDLAESLVKSGKDIGELFKSLLELIMDLLKAKIDVNYKKGLSSELNNELLILDEIQHSHLLKLIDKLQDAGSKLRFALSQELQFMIEIISMLDEDFLVSFTELKERIEKLEEGIGEVRSQKSEVRSQIPSPQPLASDFGSQTSGYLTSTLESEDKTIRCEDISVDLDATWQKIMSTIESNPTRTLLLQSGSYLLTLKNEILEIGLTKSMFLPRLEKDTKKKEMILKATKLASGIEPNTLKFRIQPREDTIKREIRDIPNNNNVSNSELELAPNITNNPTVNNKKDDDELTRTLGDLLGAKEIE